MNVTDSEGRDLEITDLEEAIKQVREFAGYDTTNGSMAFLRKQQMYYRDLLNKLLELKAHKPGTDG